MVPSSLGIEISAVSGFTSTASADALIAGADWARDALVVINASRVIIATVLNKNRGVSMKRYRKKYKKFVIPAHAGIQLDSRFSTTKALADPPQLCGGRGNDIFSFFPFLLNSPHIRANHPPLL